MAPWHVIDQSILLFVKSQICCKKLIDSQWKSARRWSRRSWRARSLPTWGSCLDQVTRFGAWCPDVQSGGCAKRKRWKCANFKFMFKGMYLCRKSMPQRSCHMRSLIRSGAKPGTGHRSRYTARSWGMGLFSLSLFLFHFGSFVPSHNV